jgi:F420-0:gamma-glutamyl ligase
MRKLLYATTALTAGGLIASGGVDAAAQQPPPYREQLPPPPPTHVSESAERIKLGLRGYYQQWAVITDQDYKTRRTHA